MDYHHDVGTNAYARDRHDVSDEIVIKVWVDRSVDCTRCRDLHEERVTVRLGFHDDFCANAAAGSGPVLHHKLLPEPI